MFFIRGNKTHSFLIIVIAALSTSLSVSAQGLVTEKIDVLGAATLISFLEKWKGGIDAVDVTEGSDGHMILTVTGRQIPHRSHHTVITVEGSTSRIREFEDEEGAEKFAKQRQAELSRKHSSTTEVFSLKHASAQELAPLLNRIARDRDFVVSAVMRGNALVITASPGTMEIVRNTVARLDAPPAPEPLPKDVKIAAYLLEGSVDSNVSGKIPAILEHVVEELSRTFQYSHYRLLDTLLVRTRERRPARISGSLPETASGETGEYSFSFDEAVVREFKDTQMVQLVNLNLRGALTTVIPTAAPQNRQGFQSRSAEPREHREFSIAADVDIREGQKVVVGKANLSGPDRAMFFVLTAEIFH